VRQVAVVPSDKPTEPVELSIGTLSSATGVPVDTLRTWERRYGFPAPNTRTGGSHRRYAADTIGHVRLIVRALELGHRPSAVVGRNLDELRRLLGPAPSVAPAVGATDADARVVARWLELTHALDGDGLIGELHRSLAEMAAIPLLERRIAPYLVEVGDAWARGLLRVSHEHYASERVREFLSAQWRRANEGQRAGRVSAVLATPSGEQHVLGLHMVAWSEVAFAAEHHSARAVALSVAAGYAGDLEAELAALCAELPRETSLVLGGAGSGAGRAVGRIVNSFEDLFTWAEALSGSTPRPPLGLPQTA
jgi:DNA-binding transcriptional MerR regulator